MPRQSLTRQVFHKSLKSNANLAKSPARALRTQSNHVFLSICAAFKLECLSLKNKLSPFCPLPQTAHQRYPISLRRTAGNFGLLHNIRYYFGNLRAGDRDRTGDIQLGKLAEN